MCDILKPPEHSAVPAQASTPELVSAGADATASVAAIMETNPYADAPAAIGADTVLGQSSSL
jgi:hypothetical protein